MYFVIGPLRTGSSLLSRCLDDHPHVMGFCESEINRTLLEPYLTQLHFLRMLHHGLKPLEIAKLLDGMKQEDVASLFAWYRKATSLLSSRLKKADVHVVGDKSPDFFRSPVLVRALSDEHRLIYSIRDPRAIYRSIFTHEGSSDQEKRGRWSSLTQNFLTWKGMLDRENVLRVRYEDLIHSPQRTMNLVYSHIGVEESTRFMTPFARLHPSRFLWKTAVDWETGIRKDFDSERVDLWRRTLTADDLAFVREDEVASDIMDQFDYQW